MLSWQMSASRVIASSRSRGQEICPTRPAARIVEADGLAVVPGFVNVLSHAWGSLQADGSGASDLLQGVTTEVFGEVLSLGPSTEDLATLAESMGLGTEARVVFDHLRDGLDHLVGLGVAPNVASFIGGHNLRLLGAGFEDRPLTAGELDRLRGIVREEMQDGALGSRPRSSTRRAATPTPTS
jgi:N-acyl-D-amino-acid deacylase